MDWNELQSLTWPGYARKNGGYGLIEADEAIEE